MPPGLYQRRIIAIAIDALMRANDDDPTPMTSDPVRALSAWEPVSQLIDQIESTGTVLYAGSKVVMYDKENGEYMDDATNAMRGVIEFHDLANEKISAKADTEQLKRFANKLDSGSMISQFDIDKTRAAIDSCIRQAMTMTVGQAKSLADTVCIRINAQMLGLVT